MVRKSKLKIAFEATPQIREVDIFVVVEHQYRTGDFHLPSLLEFPVLTFAYFVGIYCLKIPLHATH